MKRFFSCSLLFLFYSISAQAQTDKISKSAHNFYLENLAPPIAFEGAKDKAKWGIYFWEFGDGLA